MSGRPIGVRNVPDPAMTFTEIGERLGISRKMAFLHYSRGMYKIRRRPEMLARLQQLAQLTARMRDRRLGSGLGVEQ